MDLSQEEVIELIRLVRECNLEVLDIRAGDLELHASTIAESEPRTTSTGPTRTFSAPDPASEVALASERPVVSSNPSVGRASSGAGDAGAVEDTPHLAAPAGTKAVTAPLLGIFYRAPEPGADPFTKEGAFVEEDTVIGLMEVMKSYSTVVAGVRGTVIEVLAENGALVEYGQTLMLVDPGTD